MRARWMALWIVVCAVLLAEMFLTGCKSAPRRGAVPVVVVPPVNPDMAPVRAPVARARGGVERAAVMLDNLVPADAGEAGKIAALRLELRTTAAELTEALARIPGLEDDISRLMGKWREENARAAALYEQYVAERDLADGAMRKLRRAEAERDLFVNLLAVGAVVLVMMVAAPWIRRISAAAGAWAPVAALGMFLAAAGGAYFGTFWLIRLGLRIFVTMA